MSMSRISDLKKVESTLIYIQSEGKTLMMHRVKKDKDIHEGKWNGVGGKVELGEDPYNCAVREVKEETGFDVENLRLAGHLNFPNFDGENDWSVFVFVCNEFSGEMIDDCPEGELQWIENDKILDLNLWEGDYVFLKALLAGDFFMGYFTYENKQLVDSQLRVVEK